MKRILSLVAVLALAAFSAPAADIVDTAVSAGSFNTLVTAVKAAGLVDSGGAAHAAVEQGQVRVDGAVEGRKRAKLRPGQRVRFAGEEIELIAAG